MTVSLRRDWRVTVCALALLAAWDSSGWDLPLMHALGNASGFAWRDAPALRWLHAGGRVVGWAALAHLAWRVWQVWQVWRADSAPQRRLPSAIPTLSAASALSALSSLSELSFLSELSAVHSVHDEPSVASISDRVAIPKVSLHAAHTSPDARYAASTHSTHGTYSTFHACCWLGTTVLSLLVINLLKYTSNTSCPWDLAEFGGVATYVSHWALQLRDGGPGRCFPSGHSSAAFAFFSVYFLHRRVDEKRAKRLLAAVWAAGVVLSLTQIARGAHYPSHALWTAWVCWSMCCLADTALHFKRLPAPGDAGLKF